MPSKIIVFAPHPDDETLACGGTIALNIKQGNKVHIVFMTDGRYSHKHTLGIDTYPTPEDMKRIRCKEAQKVTKVLGVKRANLKFLEYEDGTLGNNINSAADKVQEILKRLKPDTLYFPARNDKHRDHKATSIIVHKVVQFLTPKPELFQYVIWRGGLVSMQTIYIDISAELPIKKLALAEYKSQTTLFSDKQKRPILIKRFLNRFMVGQEVFLVS
jgi:LmbE family N-acetylglucosaminyl deacetylase